MNIKPIKTEDDLTWALNEVEAYFVNEPEAGTPDSDRFDILSDLISAYEAKHWSIAPPDPISAIKTAMELKNITQSDLADTLGSRSRASEILTRRRGLTITQIRALSLKFGISADILIQDYKLKDTGTYARSRRLLKVKTPRGQGSRARAANRA